MQLVQTKKKTRSVWASVDGHLQALAILNDDDDYDNNCSEFTFRCSFLHARSQVSGLKCVVRALRLVSIKVPFCIM